MNKKSIDSKRQEIDEKFNQAMESLDYFEKEFKGKASK